MTMRERNLFDTLAGVFVTAGLMIVALLWMVP